MSVNDILFGLAGAGNPELTRDELDAFGNDPYISGIMPPSVERQEERQEHLPQFGPAFVPFVHERFSRLDKELSRLSEIHQWKPQTITFVGSMNSDSSGNIGVTTSGSRFYSVPSGFTLAIHRIFLAADGYTYGVPFTGAGGYWELRVDNVAISGGSLVSGSGSIPVEKTWGTRDAPHVRDGSTISLFMASGPVSKNVTIQGQGTLERNPEA